MAPRVELPIEAPDLTATELHNEVTIRLYEVLRIVFRGTALVLHDIFLRVDETRQIAPDLLIVHGSAPGRRKVYRIPAEPVPDVTIEVLSPKNDESFGRRKLQDKRELLGTIGVPVHLELDPDRGLITTWHNIDHRLVPGPPSDHDDGDHLAGLRIDLAPGQVTLRLPDGREYTDASGEYDRAEAERRRADGERRRAVRLAEALRSAGIDPESV